MKRYLKHALLGAVSAASRRHAVLLPSEAVDESRLAHVEAPYRVDRMLTHLRLSGNLEGIAGMIVGHVEGAGALGISGAEGRTGWPALVDESLSGFSWPLAWGLPTGHVPPNWTLPLGLPARLEAGSLRMVIGED